MGGVMEFAWFCAGPLQIRYDYWLGVWGTHGSENGEVSNSSPVLETLSLLLAGLTQP